MRRGYSIEYHMTMILMLMNQIIMSTQEKERKEILFLCYFQRGYVFGLPYQL
jgi:hypothetical protein